jgi:hypothetical protein
MNEKCSYHWILSNSISAVDRGYHSSQPQNLRAQQKNNAIAMQRSGAATNNRNQTALSSEECQQHH